MAGAATTNNENGNSQVGLSLETQQWITMLGFVSLNPTYDLKLFGSGLSGSGKENL